MSLVDSQSVSPNEPIHDTPILGMTTRPRVQNATEFGNPLSFWVEYPDGLVDLTRSAHLEGGGSAKPPPLVEGEQVEIPVDGDRTIRVDAKKSALVVIDMQK